MGPLQAEGAKGVKQASRILEVHVVACGAGLAVPALQEQDLLRDAGRDSRGQTPLACRNARKVRYVGPALAQQPADAITDHLTGKGFGGEDVGSAGAVLEAGKERWTVWAAKRRVLPLGAGGRDDEVVEMEPGEELEDEVEVAVLGAADGGVMPLSFAVVFTAPDVYSGGTVITRDAVSRVKAKPDVTDLQGGEFRDTQVRRRVADNVLLAALASSCGRLGSDLRGGAYRMCTAGATAPADDWAECSGGGGCDGLRDAKGV